MSNTIYSIILPVISTDKNKYNYVYQITELSSGLRYIGSRGTNLEDAYKDLKKYQSTSGNKCFKINQKLNRLNYHYEILSYHSTRREATIEEARLHALYDVKHNKKYINDANQTANGFDVSGKTLVKDKDGNIHFVNCDDSRYTSGAFVGISKGCITVKDKDGNSYQVDIDDPRYLSGELTVFTLGMVVVKDKEGNIFQVKKDDPRFLSRELVGIAAGKVTVEDQNGNKFRVAIDDPRYLSGELTQITKNKVNVKDKNGNTFQVDRNDPRFLSGELVGVNKGYVVVKNRDGEIMRVKNDDPRYLSRELVGTEKLFIIVDDKKYTAEELAKELGVSKRTIERRMRKNPNWKIVK